MSGAPADEPPVVLVHGLGSSAEHGWRPAGWLDLIADAGRTVIAPDLLGHGSAPRPHEPDAYAELESELLSALPDAAPIDAVGFSLGAQVLLRIAAREPHRFRRLVVIGVGANLFTERGRSRDLADAFAAGHEPEDLTGRLFVRMAASAGNDPLALAAFLRHPRPPFTVEELGGVTCPVLVVIGDRDFAGPPDPLVAALPDARLALLPGVDHFRVTSEFACIDAVLDFLDLAP
ncbi:MAG: alpha/beta fold hydrolase [Actinomycetota bacterium]